MKRKLAAAIVLSVFCLCTTAKAQHIDVEKWAAGNANKRVVLEYIDQVNQGDMRGASAKYGTPDYLNHRNVQSRRRAEKCGACRSRLPQGHLLRPLVHHLRAWREHRRV